MPLGREWEGTESGWIGSVPSEHHGEAVGFLYRCDAAVEEAGESVSTAGPVLYTQMSMEIWAPVWLGGVALKATMGFYPILILFPVSWLSNNAPYTLPTTVSEDQSYRDV